MILKTAQWNLVDLVAIWIEDSRIEPLFRFIFEKWAWKETGLLPNLRKDWAHLRYDSKDQNMGCVKSLLYGFWNKEIALKNRVE